MPKLKGNEATTRRAAAEPLALTQEGFNEQSGSLGMMVQYLANHAAPYRSSTGRSILVGAGWDIAPEVRRRSSVRYRATMFGLVVDTNTVGPRSVVLEEHVITSMKNRGVDPLVCAEVCPPLLIGRLVGSVLDIGTLEDPQMPEQLDAWQAGLDRITANGAHDSLSPNLRPNPDVVALAYRTGHAFVSPVLDAAVRQCVLAPKL